MAGMTRLKAALLLSGAAAGLWAAEAVHDPARPWTAQIVSDDKVVLVGTVYPSSGEGPAPAVVFIHGFGRDRADWDGHGRALAKAGVASLAFDLRGHGSSVVRRQRFHEETVTFVELTELDEGRMAADLAREVAFLRARPEVDADRIVLVGAELGANLAVRHAASDGRVAGLVLLSPRWQARSISIREEAEAACERPTLVCGAAGEPSAGEVREIGGLAAAGNPAGAFFLAEGMTQGGARLLSAAAESRAASDRVYAWIIDLLKKS